MSTTRVTSHPAEESKLPIGEGPSQLMRLLQASNSQFPPVTESATVNKTSINSQPLVKIDIIQKIIGEEIFKPSSNASSLSSSSSSLPDIKFEPAYERYLKNKFRASFLQKKFECIADFDELAVLLSLVLKSERYMYRSISDEPLYLKLNPKNKPIMAALSNFFEQERKAGQYEEIDIVIHEVKKEITVLQAMSKKDKENYLKLKKLFLAAEKSEREDKESSPLGSKEDHYSMFINSLIEIRSEKTAIIHPDLLLEFLCKVGIKGHLTLAMLLIKCGANPIDRYGDNQGLSMSSAIVHIFRHTVITKDFHDFLMNLIRVKKIDVSGLIGSDTSNTKGNSAVGLVNYIRTHTRNDPAKHSNATKFLSLLLEGGIKIKWSEFNLIDEEVSSGHLNFNEAHFFLENGVPAFLQCSRNYYIYVILQSTQASTETQVKMLILLHAFGEEFQRIIEGVIQYNKPAVLRYLHDKLGRLVFKNALMCNNMGDQWMHRVLEVSCNAHLGSFVEMIRLLLQYGMPNVPDEHKKYPIERNPTPEYKAVFADEDCMNALVTFAQALPDEQKKSCSNIAKLPNDIMLHTLSFLASRKRVLESQTLRDKLGRIYDSIKNKRTIRRFYNNAFVIFAQASRGGSEASHSSLSSLSRMPNDAMLNTLSFLAPRTKVLDKGELLAQLNYTRGFIKGFKKR